MKHIKLILLLFVFLSNLFANELNKPFFDLGHKDSVSSIAVSPNQKLIASASSGKSIKLWDIETHKELKTFDLDFDRVDFISFSIDGQTLIIGDNTNTNTIKFIDIKNGKIVDTFYDKNYKKGLVSSDRKIIAINEYGGAIKLLDTTTKKLIKKLKRDTDEIEVFAISLDGTTLVTASEYSLITVWDIKSKKIVKTINLMQSTPYIKSIAIDPNKKTLLISGEAGIFKLFDIQSGKVLKEFSHQGNTSVDSLTFSIKGNTIVSNLNNTIKFWSKESDFFLGEIDLVSSLLFFPDNKTLALGFVNGTLGLLEMESGKIVKYFGSEMGFMGSPDISPDNKKLVVSKLDPISISILEIDTLKQSEPLKGHEEWITALGYTPNGKNVVTTSADGDIILWDIEKQTELLSLKNGTSAIDMIAFSNDSNILATWDRNSTITLWNFKEKNIIHTILCDKKSIYTIAFSPDGKIFAFGGTDKTIKLLDIQSGEIVKTLNSHLDYIGSIIFSKDGKTLISGSGDKKIKFWDIQSGKELEKSQIDVKDSINWLTFSPDESMIASSEGSDTINLWDIKTKKLLKTFQGLSIIKFNNNGKVLVTRSKDRMIQYWDIANGEEIATLVNFSDGEWIVITKEGYFNISSINAMNHLNILTNTMSVGVIDKENYQTFYRPDLVKLKLQGEDITRLIKQEDGKK